MANYGEELGYWYLRLNGFFPITNFVFHSLSSETRKARYNADADLLAIRPPNVSEVLMEETLKWDDKIISDHDQSKFVFVYCEVKTGEYDASKLFAEERIQYAKKRFGLSADYSSVERVFKTILIANEEKPNNLNRFKGISKNVIKGIDKHKSQRRLQTGAA